ncbi:glycoside hydrolase domain-containing protein [Nocardia sp. NPDC127526]|uniref:glycoside hydrolase domain-containing protein n=1 Tax=Nocardia sp. NPDC127526 TaxID=3345393 RepID=UPI003628D6B5
MFTAVDFAARLIDPHAIKAAGHTAVLVYVAPSRPGAAFGAKPVTREYTEALTAAGLQIVSCYQFGKPGDAQSPSDWTLGYEGGQRMGLQAKENHHAAGGPDWCPIFFAVDEDISLDEWNDTAVHFFRGVNDAIGREWTGIYGHARVCAWAIEDGVVGRTREGKYWAWQTRAWSRGEREDNAVLFQRVIDTPSSPGPLIDGSSVDVNDILAGDFGQWSSNRAPARSGRPDFIELDLTGDSHQSRHGARITNFLLHTQEGDGTAESLAAYLNNRANGVSYHYTLRDGVLCRVVPNDRASWSVLDANSYTLNLCFAGSRGAWSREQWLEREPDLRIAAWIAVRDARDCGFEPVVIAPPYTRRDGISDHNYVTQVLGFGTHWDVGPNFPWDVFADFVAEFAAGDEPSRNMIDEKAAQTPWLGNRITQGENTCPDGEGRYAEFEHGYVYWHPRTEAHPIPAALWDKFAEMKHETGELGYPVNDHTVLVDATGAEQGVVQGFQHGAIYRRTGKPAYVLRGAVRECWNRSGFEKGPLGWAEGDEISCETGAYQRFEHGTVYWTRQPTLAVLDGAVQPLTVTA